MSTNTVLLATFTNKRNYKKEIERIIDSGYLSGNKIFVLKCIDSPHETILTYNVDKSKNVEYSHSSNTISLHRKKDTNTLFTLNALNLIVQNQTGNQDIDPNYSVNWSDYENCVVLTSKIDSNNLHVYNTELLKIYYVK